MTVPTDAARAQTRVSTTSGVHTINLPSGISAGDLLVAVTVWDGSGIGGGTYPSGWTIFSPQFIYGAAESWVPNYGGSLFNCYGIYRIADGSEGSTIAIDPVPSEASNTLVWRISAGTFDPAYPPKVWVQTGNSNAPNPPDWDPCWGITDWLSLAGQGADSGTGSAGFAPTGYGNTFGGTGAPESGGVSARGGSKGITGVANEDPGAGTLGAADEWVGFTVAIKGTADESLAHSPHDRDSVPTRPDASPTTTMPVNLPPDIEAGDLLLMILGQDGLGGLASITTPTGWTSLGTQSTGAGDAQVKMATYYRLADGSEGNHVDVTQASAKGWGAIVKRIKGWESSTAPEIGFATGSSAAADPPSLSPSWGAKPTLYVAAAVVNQGGYNLITGLPSGFEKFMRQAAQSGHTNSICSAACSKYDESGTVNPAAFTNANQNWVAATIAVLNGPSGRRLAKATGWVG